MEGWKSKESAWVGSIRPTRGTWPARWASSAGPAGCPTCGRSHGDPRRHPRACRTRRPLASHRHRAGAPGTARTPSRCDTSRGSPTSHPSARTAANDRWGPADRQDDARHRRFTPPAAMPSSGPSACGWNPPSATPRIATTGADANLSQRRRLRASFHTRWSGRPWVDAPALRRGWLSHTLPKHPGATSAACLWSGASCTKRAPCRVAPATAGLPVGHRRHRRCRHCRRCAISKGAKAKRRTRRGDDGSVPLPSRPAH